MDAISSMLDLMRRLPPTKIEENVDVLMQISPDYADELSGNVDRPLKLRVDRSTGKEYLACVYNQDGDSYRCVRRPPCAIHARGHLTPSLCGGYMMVDVLGRLGRTNMTRLRRTDLCPLRSCGSSRLRRTRRSICTARCKSSFGSLTPS